MTSIMRHLASEEMRTPWPTAIRHVALCGWPKCGKSTIAAMLEDEFGAQIIDDGMILRKAVPVLFGIPEDEPFTQEGKDRVYNVCGREETVRQMLGELGNYLEARYSDEFMPIRAMQVAQKLYPAANFYVYPSVRKVQGRAYKRMGGIVVQIDNPNAPPSDNPFDRWDKSFVDITINNDPSEMSLDELRAFICELPNLIIV
jgi:hypothetical protein